MEAILIRAGSFLAIILLGYLLRRTGFLPESAMEVLSKLVVRVTLPAVIVTSYAGKAFDPSMLIIAAVGFGGNLLYLLAAFAMGYRRSRQDRAFDVVNLPGYNIGTFTLPFVQSFLGPVALMTTTLFDTGAAVYSLGGTYSVGAMIRDRCGFSLRRMGHTLIRSMPFMTYMIMLAMALLGWSLPKPVLEFAGIIGNANAFLAMLMIGVGFRLELKKEYLRHLFRLLGARYLLAVAAAVVCWFCLPFAEEIRRALVLLVFSPTASASPAWTKELDGDVGLSSALGSVSILISIPVILLLLLL